MDSLLRRTLKNDTTRSTIYLLLGVLLFLGAGQSFLSTLAKVRDAGYATAPGTQTLAPQPERHVPPAPVEYPFF